LSSKKKADDVYRLGIARKAAPIERLKNRHTAFLTRIMAPPSGQVPDDDPAPAPTPSASQRNALGQRSGSSGLAGATTQASGSRSTSTARNGAKMMVFTEDAGAPAEQPETTPWDDFGTRDGRR
jgi:checkpoint serine/threonine-protein kinase